jgi:hypothetical protein
MIGMISRSCSTARYSEIDVAGRVDQVKLVKLAISGRVLHPHRFSFDGDALFTFEVHRIQHLRHHVALRERAGTLEQPIGQGGLTVVDVGDDDEVADVCLVHSVESLTRCQC